MLYLNQFPEHIPNMYQGSYKIFISERLRYALPGNILKALLLRESFTYWK